MKYALAVALLLAASCAKADSVDFTILTDPLPDSGDSSFAIGSGFLTYQPFVNTCSYDTNAAYHITGMSGSVGGIPIAFASSDPCAGDNLAVKGSSIVLDWYLPLTFSVGNETITAQSLGYSDPDLTYDFPLYGMTDPNGLIYYAFMELADAPVSTPEPPTWMMLAISLALFWSFRPKRKAIQA